MSPYGSIYIAIPPANTISPSLHTIRHQDAFPCLYQYIHISLPNICMAHKQMHSQRAKPNIFSRIYSRTKNGRVCQHFSKCANQRCEHLRDGDDKWTNHTFYLSKTLTRVLANLVVVRLVCFCFTCAAAHNLKHICECAVWTTWEVFVCLLSAFNCLGSADENYMRCEIKYGFYIQKSEYVVFVRCKSFCKSAPLVHIYTIRVAWMLSSNEWATGNTRYMEEHLRWLGVVCGVVDDGHRTEWWMQKMWMFTLNLYGLCLGPTRTMRCPAHVIAHDHISTKRIHTNNQTIQMHVQDGAKRFFAQ